MNSKSAYANLIHSVSSNKTAVNFSNSPKDQTQSKTQTLTDSAEYLDPKFLKSILLKDLVPHKHSNETIAALSTLSKIADANNGSPVAPLPINMVQVNARPVQRNSFTPKTRKNEETLIPQSVAKSLKNLTRQDTAAIQPGYVASPITASVSQQIPSALQPSPLKVSTGSAKTAINYPLNGKSRSIVSEDDEDTSAMDQTTSVQLQYALQDNILNTWPYKGYISAPGDLMLDQGLIDRGRVTRGSGLRLSNFFKRAVEGKSVTTALVSSPVSKIFTKDPASRKWIYPNTFRIWWNRNIMPITGSKMYLKDATVEGVGTDYMAKCLRSHLPTSPHLILWELSENDYKKGGKLSPEDTEELEKMLRNSLEYRSRPEVILLNMFKGESANKASYCRAVSETGEEKLAKHYDCTLLSWSKSVCPYLLNDKEGFLYSYLFARDHIHPSVIGHAQMAYMLIDYVRDEFLRYLDAPRMKAHIELPLPRAMYLTTEEEDPLCYTTMKASPKKEAPFNTLPIMVMSSKEFEGAVSRSSIGGKGYTARNKIQPIMLKFRTPYFKKFKRLSILPHLTTPVKTVARIDNFPFSSLDVRPQNRGRLWSIPTWNLKPGNHLLRVWSLDKRFRIMAVTLD